MSNRPLNQPPKSREHLLNPSQPIPLKRTTIHEPATKEPKTKPRQSKNTQIRPVKSRIYSPYPYKNPFPTYNFPLPRSSAILSSFSVGKSLIQSPNRSSGAVNNAARFSR